jgi:hypothetical protein
MNKCLESCTGLAVVEWEREFLASLNLSDEQLFDYIEKHSPEMREHYCSEVCPVAKFRRKYGQR